MTSDQSLVTSQAPFLQAPALSRKSTGTLLKTLANQRKAYHARVRCGTTHSSQRRSSGATAATCSKYCPEDDVHCFLTALTLDQTVRFAAETRLPCTRIDSYTREERVTQIT